MSGGDSVLLGEVVEGFAVGGGRGLEALVGVLGAVGGIGSWKWTRKIAVWNPGSVTRSVAVAEGLTFDQSVAAEPA